jgi:hypothetical protein
LAAVRTPSVAAESSARTEGGPRFDGFAGWAFVREKGKSMKRLTLAACSAILALSIAPTANAAPPVFHIDDDAVCSDGNRQAQTITGGWAGFANQAYFIVWLETDPATDPNTLYSLEIVHKGETVLSGGFAQFPFVCGAPDSAFRYGEMVYGGFISGDKYTFIIRDSSGAELGRDSVKFVNGPGI